MLYIPERHNPIPEVKWDPKIATNLIKDDFYRTLDAFDYKSLWPTHPDEDTSDNPSKNIYMGAIGTLLGLFNIHSSLNITNNIDFSSMAQTIVDLYYEKPDFGIAMPSYFLGEAGILHTHYTITQSSTYLDKLFNILESNIGNPANELLNGDPGTMQVSLDMYHKTNDSKWLSLYKKSTNKLLKDSIEYEKDIWGWEQNLWGQKYKYLGAAHGIFGNYGAMLAGIEYLDEGTREEVIKRTELAASKTVTIEKSLANWPTAYNDKYFLVQWCHGAPGIIQELLKYKGKFSETINDIIVKSGNLIYEAGIVKKGPSLCHGTTGNALALWKIYEYTNDTSWLSKAQSLAMCSLEQINADRYGLWTGKQGSLEAIAKYFL